MFDQVFTQGLVDFAGAKQHAVRNNGGGTAAEFEHTQNAHDKQQLGLLGFYYL
ncbi:hypothetical protein D3C75_1301420 [compost metagenome]